MRLHNDKKFFEQTVRATSQHLGIKVEFVEKDYWITFVLSQLAKSKYAEQTVFKGGTSLSKAYGLINRFSEDVDIAIIDELHKSGNSIKSLIRTVEKEMTRELHEKDIAGVSSKGSRFRKSVFEYPSFDAKNGSNKLIVEVNSFANPYPFQKKSINSLVFDFLAQSGNNKYIEEFELHPFELNVLNKEQTLIEKLVSLIRFSFDDNAIISIASKIRHFYDLYYLLSDEECIQIVHSNTFKSDFFELLQHDKAIFDVPKGWSDKTISDSQLVNNFDEVWKQLKEIYITELSALAFAEIPNEKLVADKFKELIALVR